MLFQRKGIWIVALSCGLSLGLAACNGSSDSDDDDNDDGNGTSGEDREQVELEVEAREISLVLSWNAEDFPADATYNLCWAEEELTADFENCSAHESGKLLLDQATPLEVSDFDPSNRQHFQLEVEIDDEAPRYSEPVEGVAQSKVVTHAFSQQEVDDTLAYWTPERMEAAKPPRTPDQVDGPPDPSAPNIPAPGDPVERGGVGPRLEFVDRSTATTHALTPVTASEDDVPEKAEHVESTASYPQSAVGKVYFTKPGDGNYVCSASVIASESRRVVWTAGHCLSDGGEGDWYTNWMFVPAYNDGDEPLGRWSATHLATFAGWLYDRNFHYDLGAVVMQPKSGNAITDYTGSLGWRFKGAHETDTSQMGYPSAGDVFDGEKHWRCDQDYLGAITRTDDDGDDFPGPSMKYNDCDFSAGSSGGPWVVDFDECPACYTNSVTSLWYFDADEDGDPLPPVLANYLAGPYHGSAGLKLLKVAEDLP